MTMIPRARMDPAALRHRVTLEARTDTPDGAGGVNTVWSAQASLWASIDPNTSDQIIRAEARRQRTTHKILMRRRKDVTSAMRIRHGTRIFEIRAVVDPHETGIWTLCRCEQIL
ncbi:MAG: phage head closure protein [Pseudomonadota bacterium]